MKPLLVVGGAVVLLHFEPDHGAMVILLATVFCLIFLAGAKISRFFPLLLPAWWCDLHRSMKSYVLERFTSYWNPWAAENVFNGGYQLTQALIAFGRGEWFGVGLGNSIQKLYFLPRSTQ